MPKSKDTREMTLTPQQALLVVNMLIHAGDMSKAREIAKKAALAPAFSALAAADAVSGVYEQAKAEFEKALELDGTYLPAREGLAALLVILAAQSAAQKNWTDTQSFLRRACDLAPENMAARRYLGAVEAMVIMDGISPEKLEEAIPLLEKIQASELSRMDVAHQLAMMYHRLAIELEGTSQTSSRDHVWQMAFANWAMVIFSDQYWKQWINARLAVYQDEHAKSIPAAEIEILRHKTIPDAIMGIHQQYIRSYSDAKEKAQAARHQRLRVAWILEYDTAKALHETLRLIDKPNAEIQPDVACGPIMWKQLGLEQKVVEAVRIAQGIKPSFEPARTVLDATTPVGLSLAYQQEGLLQEAIDLLKKHLDSKPSDPARACEVMVLLLNSQAESFVNTDLKKAIKYWNEAEEYGAPKGDYSGKIGEAVLRQAKQAQEQGDLDKAYRLVRTGLEHVPDNRVLKAMLAEVAMAQVNKLLPEGSKSLSKKDEKKLDEAEALLDEAAELAGHDNVAIKRGQKQIEVTRYNQAMEIANQAIQQFYEADADYAKTMEDINDAVKAITKAAEAFPEEKKIRKNLDDLLVMRQKIQEVGSRKEIASGYQAALNDANNALSSYQPGVNYDETIHDIDQALKALNDAARAFPDQKAIKKNINDLGAMRQKISKAEAVNMFNTAVGMVNEMQNMYGSRIDYSNRNEIVGVLLQAERMLDQANDLDPGNSIVRKNLKTVKDMLDKIGRY